MSQEWYYAKGDQKQGPITSGQLKALATAGKLMPNDLVWTDGMTDWRKASSVKGLFAPSPSVPPPVEATTPIKPPPLISDSEFVGLVGSVAVHRQQPWYCHWSFLSLTTLLCFPATLILVWWKSTYSKRAKWAWTGACGLMLLAIANSPKQPNEADRQDASTGRRETAQRTQEVPPEKTRPQETPTSKQPEKIQRGFFGIGAEDFRANMLAFKDDPSAFKGKSVTGEMEYDGEGGQLATDLKHWPVAFMRAPFTVYSSAGVYQIRLIIPRTLSVPNAGSTENLLVKFNCNSGEFDDGNVVTAIERK